VRGKGTAEPAGLEPDLIRSWAGLMRIRIEWVPASEAQLVLSLEQNVLDIAIAGFTADTPWSARIGRTQPYLESQIVIGVAPQTPKPDSWKDIEIKYDRRLPHLAALIRGLGAIPVSAEPDRRKPVAAAYALELAGLGLKATDTVLVDESRIIATAPAENALVLALDRFLHSRRAAIETGIADEASP
jgi:ABC-type amino acid transport substrate-binding protein